MSRELLGVQQRFLAVPWHDSKVLSIRIGSTTRVVYHNVEIEFDLLLEVKESASAWQLSRLTFGEAREFGADLDLMAKAQCDHAVFGVECAVIEVEDDGEGTKHVMRFSIALCPPSGSLTIVAQDFVLEPLGERRIVSAVHPPTRR